jgi:hypothetical protein
MGNKRLALKITPPKQNTSLFLFQADFRSAEVPTPDPVQQSGGGGG